MTGTASSEPKTIGRKTSLGTVQHVRATAGPSQLKYYIHDSVDSCRLQFFGVLRETDLTELNGCWQTARTILGLRQLVLDLRGLTNADEAGKKWLLSMRDEGAAYLPEDYFRAGPHKTRSPEPSARGRIGLVNRVLSAFRGSRELPVESSTQAQ
jgi:hypothetical protein